MRNAFVSALEEAAAEDQRIMLITGDLGFGVFNKFKANYNKQFLNAGIAEQNMTGLATGLALEGRIVFTYSIGNFCTLRCLEQIRNDACYHDADVKIVSIGGGFSYGALGVSHHATEDLAIMRSIPGLTVVSPCGLWEASQATKALVKTPGTCFLRLDKSFGNDMPQKGCPDVFEIGKSRILKQGKDITIIVTGGILSEVDMATQVLEKKGISVQIISMHTIKPLDKKTILDAARQTRRVVTVEEHTIDGGLGGAVAEIILDNKLSLEMFLRIGLTAGFSSIVGSQNFLRTKYGIDSKAIVKKILRSMKMD